MAGKRQKATKVKCKRKESFTNAAFWLVELLPGYMLQPTSSEKRLLFGGKKGLKSSFK